MRFFYHSPPDSCELKSQNTFIDGESLCELSITFTGVRHVSLYSDAGISSSLMLSGPLFHLFWIIPSADAVFFIIVASSSCTIHTDDVLLEHIQKAKKNSKRRDKLTENTFPSLIRGSVFARAKDSASSPNSHGQTFGISTLIKRERSKMK